MGRVRKNFYSVLSSNVDFAEYSQLLVVANRLRKQIKELEEEENEEV